MGLFGMSESELKKFAENLEKRETELKNKESDVARDAVNVQHERSQLMTDKAAFDHEREAYLADKADFAKRREEVIRMEAEAKKGFATQQNEAFREVIEKRLEELKAREEDLDAQERRLADDLKKICEREGEVAKRDLAVTEREQKADAGFADKATALADEAKRQLQANIDRANLLKQQAEQQSEVQTQLERDRETLRQREVAVAEAERTRDAGYSEERAKLDAELNGKRAAWQVEELAMHDKVAKQEVKLLSELDAKVSEVRKERYANMEADVEKERARMLSAANREVKEIREQAVREREENQARAGELNAREDAVEVRSHELDARERDLEMRNGDLDSKVDELVAERKASFEACEATMKDEIQRLRDSLREQEALVGIFEQLKRQLGDRDAAEVLRDLDVKTAELSQLREQLSQPNPEMQKRIDALQKKADEAQTRADVKEKELEESQAAVAESNALRRDRDELAKDKESLQKQLDNVTAEATRIEAELRRLRTAYERPSEVAARYREIEMPFIMADKFTAPENDQERKELEWLEDIRKNCIAFGFDFPERIIKAFHTSLKTYEWSPITVLAGVSGTGKSKLPELYARFGGLVFDLLDVQPNWDSQESMLGYFNSIDNKFDAQSVLKLLAQSQIPNGESYDDRVKRWREMAGSALSLDPEKDKVLIDSLKNITVPGLAESMSLVLLDEMNLAHPELYFAGFLSKLEERSGKTKLSVPSLEVKIGAGLPPYKLPLGRNVLWVGTMNQDETTKSLSDKVLDRSTVIFFPRPRTLKGREKLTPMNNKKNAPLLHKDTFDRWIVRDCSKISKFAEPYKAFVEKINDAMGSVGRAVGHRVWQSIEFYMANYPDVRAALGEGGDEVALKKSLHVAFEDQLVQKIMPKLRGIDCHGAAKVKCLDVIRQLLMTGVNGDSFKNLGEDFKRACELGYGQFMWQSADYLNVSDEASAEEETPATEVQS